MSQICPILMPKWPTFRPVWHPLFPGPRLSCKCRHGQWCIIENKHYTSSWRITPARRLIDLQSWEERRREEGGEHLTFIYKKRDNMPHCGFGVTLFCLLARVEKERGVGGRRGGSQKSECIWCVSLGKRWSFRKWWLESKSQGFVLRVIVLSLRSLLCSINTGNQCGLTWG